MKIWMKQSHRSTVGQNLWHCISLQEAAGQKKKVLGQISYGGGCVNDTVVHLATSHMPFGGVGESGMGSYHGKAGFDTFTHRKSILKKALWLDLPVRYPPYKGHLRLLKKLM